MAVVDMPPGFTQSVSSTFVDKRGGHNGVNKREISIYCYTASCGTKFTRHNAAWHHHDPSGVARRAFDEAKEAAKEAAKRVSKEAAWEAARPAREAAWEAARPAREAARPAKEAAREAAMSSSYEHREWRRDMPR
jgi:hypothetical protein